MNAAPIVESCDDHVDNHRGSRMAIHCHDVTRAIASSSPRSSSIASSLFFDAVFVIFVIHHQCPSKLLIGYEQKDWNLD